VRAPPADVEEPFQTPVELNVEFPCCNPTCRWKGDGARYHAKPTTGLVTVLYAAQQCSCVTVFGLCNTPSCDRALEWVGHSDRCAPSGRRERERLGSWRGSRGRWKRALAFKPGGRRERERERLGSLRGSRGRWKLAFAFKPGGRRERERERERERLGSWRGSRGRWKRALAFKPPPGVRMLPRCVLTRGKEIERMRAPVKLAPPPLPADGSSAECAAAGVHVNCARRTGQ
jgi:hypothetical protein